jgi:hypothetical protein
MYLLSHVCKNNVIMITLLWALTGATAPNRMVYATRTSAPVYDYTPAPIDSPFLGLPADFFPAQGIGVSVIVSVIHVNADLNLPGSVMAYSHDHTTGGRTCAERTEEGTGQIEKS